MLHQRLSPEEWAEARLKRVSPQQLNTWLTEYCTAQVQYLEGFPDSDLRDPFVERLKLWDIEGKAIYGASNEWLSITPWDLFSPLPASENLKKLWMHLSKHPAPQGTRPARIPLPSPHNEASGAGEEDL
jgi:hypothetical protein